MRLKLATKSLSAPLRLFTAGLWMCLKLTVSLGACQKPTSSLRVCFKQVVTPRTVGMLAVAWSSNCLMFYISAVSSDRPTDNTDILAQLRVSFGCVWTQLQLFRCVWNKLLALGYPWNNCKSSNVSQVHCESSDVYATSCKSSDVYETSCKSSDVYETSCKSSDVYETICKSSDVSAVIANESVLSPCLRRTAKSWDINLMWQIVNWSTSDTPLVDCRKYLTLMQMNCAHFFFFFFCVDVNLCLQNRWIFFLFKLRVV